MTWNRERAIQFSWFLLRIVVGLLYFQVGTDKTFGWFGGMPGHPGPAPLLTQIGIGGWLEVIGGLLVMLGLFTRPVAFILSGEMAVAYWQFHAPSGGFWPIQNGGGDAVLFCFIFLFMAAFGGGDWSLDALIRKRR
jgi:putative oxidoreductase